MLELAKLMSYYILQALVKPPEETSRPFTIVLVSAQYYMVYYKQRLPMKLDEADSGMRNQISNHFILCCRYVNFVFPATEVLM